MRRYLFDHLTPCDYRRIMSAESVWRERMERGLNRHTPPARTEPKGKKDEHAEYVDDMQKEDGDPGELGHCGRMNIRRGGGLSTQRAMSGDRTAGLGEKDAAPVEEKVSE